MTLKLVIAALLAVLTVSQARTAWAGANRTAVGAIGINVNGTHVNSRSTQGVGVNDAGGAVVNSVDLPAPVAH